MATEAEACRRPTQSQTTTGSLPVNTEQASEVDLKKPLTGEETVDRPSLHDIPTAGATFGTKSNEDAPEDRLVGEQYGQNTTPFEQQKQNQGIDAHQDKTKQAPDLETLTHTIDGLAGEMDVPQDQAELERELLYDVFSATKHLRRPLSDRVSSGKRRVVQTMSYMQLVEDRLLFLETKMDKINQHIRSLTGQPPEETEKSKKDAQASRQLILEVNRISIAEDQARKKTAVQEVDRSRARARRNESDSVHPSTYEGKLWTRHIIDVVVPEMGSGNSFTTPLSLSANVKPNSADPANPEPGENQRQSPSRVRIHSTLLLDLLKHISDDQFVTHERAGQCHQTFLQPFKLFVTYEVEIRKWAEKLEEKLNDESLPSETNGAGEKWTKKEITKPQKLDKPQNDASENPVIAQNPTSSDLSKGESATASHLDPLWTRECLDHLKVLIQLFDNDLKPVFDHHRDAISGKLRSIAFAELWHLFGSGEDIQSANGHPQVCRVLTSAGGRPFLSTKRDAGMARDEEESSIITSNGSPFIIQAFCYDFDGSAIGAVERTFTIQRYEGKRLITSLPCYPVRFAKTARDLAQYRQELMDRGRRFAQLATDNQKIHYRYSGLTLDEVSQPKEQISSDVIIDFTMAFLANKEWELKIGIGPQLPPDPRETLEVIDAEDTQFEGINETVHKDYNIDSQRLKSFLEKEKPNLGSSISVQDLKADDFLLFPNRVLGFVLRSRKWASFAVANIEDIIQQDAGFDQLILPEGHRDTLLALVQTHAQAVRPTQEDMLHTSKQTDELDLVRGKGKGLIILLHGEPGVGKTSTAESIAAYTDRPLFAVTCGDIGQTAEDVESRLETNFQLAHRWGCVLLLDEADVFLDKRSKHDIQRNAIVSVFLRVLEYYSGILFLTTNRIGTFDPAFRSRIHMSLYYPRLDETSTKKVWEVNMARSKALWQDKIQFDDKNVAQILHYALEHYKELKKTKTTWNGRQIRNAFQTAIAIAEYEAHRTAERYKLPEIPKACLEKSHFEKVARASSHFDRYLKMTWGGTERDLARETLERRDSFADSDDGDRGARRTRKSGRRRRGSDDYESPTDEGRRHGDGSD